MKAKIKKGAFVRQDFGVHKWPHHESFDVDQIFDVFDFNAERFRLIADGFGVLSAKNGEYGNGALYVEKEDLIFEGVTEHTKNKREKISIAKKVFLGGTCADSMWRGKMIVYLQEQGLDWFDPVVDDWDEEAQENELRERRECDFCLYTITPKMTGVYAIAEVVEDSIKRPEKAVFIVLREDEGKKFTDAQWKSLMQVGRMVRHNGGLFSDDLMYAAEMMGGNAE